MSWETRPWAMRPSDSVRTMPWGSLLGKRVRLTLDPRAFEYEDANDLRVEGELLACSNNGPTIILADPVYRAAMIDVLAVEVLP